MITKGKGMYICMYCASYIEELKLLWHPVTFGTNSNDKVLHYLSQCKIINFLTTEDR